jgi:hypothetical protein
MSIVKALLKKKYEQDNFIVLIVKYTNILWSFNYVIYISKLLHYFYVLINKLK